jgi:phosphotransferase system enzyme I (PtsI)
MSLSPSKPSKASGTSEGHRPIILRGTGVSPGIVIARALIFQHREMPIFRIPLAKSEIEKESARLEAARRLTRRQLREMKARTVEALGEEHAYIFDAQILMLDDALLVERVLSIIESQRVNAEWALRQTLSEIARVFDGLKDEYMRERKGDVFDVSGRLLRNLAGGQQRSLGKLDREYILVSQNVHPSDTAQLDWEHTAGLAMEGGSPTYHTAVIARSMGIPCVVGVRQLIGKVDPGATLIIDGGEGVVVVNPDRPTLRDYRAKRRKRQLLEKRLAGLRELPAETVDGYRIRLQANIDFPKECSAASQVGAEGVGLFRSEWFLTAGGEFPTEDDQYRAFRSVARQMHPHSVIVRTFDLSVEQFREIEGPKNHGEPNPALGLRGTRLLLQEHREILRAQLRALLRAHTRGNLKVMFPMISGVEEFREAKAVLDEAREELAAKGQEFNPELPCGITLEVPSAAATADLLARECDFISIGTNDLIQYCLAVDRGNEEVSYLYDPLHPAILRTIRFVIESAHKEGITVGMCGEMAADPLLVVLLVGLGLDELSMNAVSIPSVKNITRSLSAREAREIATRALELPTAQEVADFVAGHMSDRLRDGLYYRSY